jgi:hypothetical protein
VDVAFNRGENDRTSETILQKHSVFHQDRLFLLHNNRHITFSDATSPDMAWAASRSFSIKGTKWPTAFFITRADLIT